ncbi:ATP-binding protein [Kineococcus gynurae]|uniref:ATP-binding protein n=1 Tax=Kineococcus gynurae TaxID=452979 RepID=A0ABV5LSE3_9ACTN
MQWDLSAARAARRFLEEHWCDEHTAVSLEHAHLLVSELVTNAVQHGSPPVTVALDCDPETGATIRVHDGGDAGPRLTTAVPEDTSGRGVALVAAVSADWGVQRDPQGRAGKTVWCRLAP